MALAVCDGLTFRQRAQGKVRQRDAGQDIYLGRWNRCTIGNELIPIACMILASSGEEDFFVKKSRKAAFEPKTFLAKMGDGKTITEYQKDQVVFASTPALEGGAAEAATATMRPAPLRVTTATAKNRDSQSEPRASTDSQPPGWSATRPRTLKALPKRRARAGVAQVAARVGIDAEYPSDSHRRR